MGKTTRFACALLLLPATSALGADGVIEIDPASVAAGGITAGDLPGDPVTISETGSYILTDTLQGVEIVIEPAVPGQRLFVTLDLNGFPILTTGIDVRSSGTVLRLRGGNLEGPLSVAAGSSVIASDLTTTISVSDLEIRSNSIVRDVRGALGFPVVAIEENSVVTDSTIGVTSTGDGRSVVARVDSVDLTFDCASQCVLRDLDATGTTVSSGSGTGQYGGVVARSQIRALSVTDGAVVYENDLFQGITLLPQTGAPNINALGAARNNIEDANGFVNDTGGGAAGRIVEIAPNLCNGSGCPTCTELISCAP